MSDDDLTLKEAAQHFGVSIQTIRRWIKDGKIEAELRDSPYGQQYYIPAYQIRTAAEIQDVVRVDRTVEMASLAHVMERYISEREQALLNALGTMQAEIRESIQRGEQREQELRQEIAATREENDRLHQALYERLNQQEKRAEERDQMLTQTMKMMLEQAQERAQEESKQKKGWWPWRR